jgi:Poly(3-hydroxyalkanoate) synthetase
MLHRRGDPYEGPYHFPKAHIHDRWSAILMTQDSGHETVHPIDRMFHAWLGRMTLGLSPAALMGAYLEWLVQLAQSLGKQGELFQKAARKTMRFALFAVKAAIAPDSSPCVDPLPQDHRFRDPAWQAWPFKCLYQSFLLTQQWWHNAVTGIGGVSRKHEEAVSFMARQVLDVFSPSNFLFTNPVILEATRAQLGAKPWGCSRTTLRPGGRSTRSTSSRIPRR